MEIHDIYGIILMINVYFPYRKTGDENRILYLETLGIIGNIIESNPSAKFIITGDINCNLYDTSQELSGVVNQFLHDNGLISSHELDETVDPSNSYTRCCETSGTYSLLDREVQRRLR